MRMLPYRPLPALTAFLLFLAAGSLLVGWIMGADEGLTPLQEMQCVQYALALPEEPPEELTRGDLEDLLGQLDEKFRPIAGRVTVVAYEAGDHGFLLQAVHADEPGRTFTVDLRGIR
jgi:hypothetical protein